MSRKLTIALIAAFLVLVAVIGFLLNRKATPKSAAPATTKTPKLDTSPPKFPE